MSDRLRVCALYPELMNIYADRGNIAVLRARCEWRGLGFELASASLGEPVDPDRHDLFYLGGGQDRDQALVAEDMVASKRDALHAAAARGAVVLAVCGGYQLLGHSYELGDRRLPGIGLVDLHTVRAPGPRLIGNCAIEADLGDGPRVIAGFENHGGRTYLGDEEEPLGRVLSGHGNNGRDHQEGVRRANVIGTYLHGPLLPKNVWLADRVIELALGIELAPLADDSLEDAAHAAARRAAGVAYGPAHTVMTTLPRAWPARMYRMAVGHLAQRVGPVDDRCDLPCFDELLEDDHVLVVLPGDESAQLLAHEPRQQERPELPVGAAEQASIGLASGDDSVPFGVSARRRRDRDEFPPMSRIRS